ncbi:mevalonate kinase [Diplocarpon rosae]|nr:mevalonate kinase [Diplocarpon rosae]
MAENRRSFGGKLEPLDTRPRSRSSSSTTSAPVETPTDTDTDSSPSPLSLASFGSAKAMAKRVQVDSELADGLAKAEISGSETARKPINRKQSSPMMPAFMVSAPGKVIVFGEHAVVYGKAAIAASISLRSYLLVTALSKSKRTITLRFPDINLSHTWNIDDLPWDVFSQPGKKKYYYDLVTALDPELVAAMKPHLANVSRDAPDDLRKVHQNSASAFLYLFLSLGSPSFPGSIYTLRSTIPIGSGLGSSASICVCLAASLLLQLRILSGPHPDQPSEEARLQIERVNRWAFVGEMCIHGNPSGVDNTVVAQGKAVVYRRLDYSKPPSVSSIWNFPELPLLVVDTKQPKSTAFEVAKVAKLKKSHPEITDSVIHSIDMVSEGARRLLSGDEFDSKEMSSLERLGKLMTINHGLLAALGVSHPRLERLRELVDHEGIGWTKLTGAGGGGCAITLLQPEITRERMKRLESTLEGEGYNPFVTMLGCDGVGVLWPAVLKNGSEDDDGGEEIDQEKFLNADGIEGVEALVGVHGESGEDREAWKFWRVEREG